VPAASLENIIPPSPTRPRRRRRSLSHHPHRRHRQPLPRLERAGHFGHADICLSNCNAESISHSSKLESLLGGLSMFDSTGATRRRCLVLVSLPERRETVTISPRQNAACSPIRRQTDEARMAVLLASKPASSFSTGSARAPASAFVLLSGVKHQRALCGTPSPW